METQELKKRDWYMEHARHKVRGARKVQEHVEHEAPERVRHEAREAQKHIRQEAREP